MRLHLIIQRHSLPTVYLLWSVSNILGPASTTISQLLEQVDGIIPLEAEEWGLEDYIVEVRGFECLHFSELSQILKEDDEVRIRPLETSELRFRKVSGRHQITVDGKHLIDGVTFGRPFLRLTDRPPIKIPPRKRRRITYEEDNFAGFAESETDGQIAATALSDDEDDGSWAESDDGEDDDLSLEKDGSSEANVEFEDSHEIERYQGQHGDLAADGLTAPSSNTAEDVPQRMTRAARKGLGLQEESLLELVDKHGKPYPQEYSNPLLDSYENDEPARLQSTISTTQKETPTPQSSKTHKDSIEARLTSNDNCRRWKPGQGTKGVRVEDGGSTTPATVRDFEKNDSSINEKSILTQEWTCLDESDKENSEPPRYVYGADAKLDNSSSTSTSASSNFDTDTEETSSSGSSDDSTSSESGYEESAPVPDTQHDVPDSSPKNSSPFDNRSSTSEKNQSSEASREERDTKMTDSSSVDIQPSVSLEAKTPKTSLFSPANKAPHQGKRRTQERNRRRRKTKRLRYLQSTGILPSTATYSDHSGSNDKANKVHGGCKKLRKSESSESTTAQKDSLGKDVAPNSLGIAQSTEQENPGTGEKTFNEAPSTANSKSTEMFSTKETHDKAYQDPTVIIGPENVLNSTLLESDPIQHSISSASSKRRSTLDVESSRRLLFGSLGFRAPKTTEDVMNIKARLTKDMKPPFTPHSSENLKMNDVSVANTDENDNWKDRITLMAVECCEEGIKLSTPPFPFVQRWDPQQQKNFQGKQGTRRGKKRKRNNKQYYNETSQREIDVGPPQGLDQIPSPIEAPLDTSECYEERIDDGVSHVGGEEYDEATSEQLRRETDAANSAPADTQDLPDLPENIADYPLLKEPKVTPGTIIAFKQLDMSEDTNWQPRVSEYRTANVESLGDDGTLRMTLAKRDRLAKDKQYDWRTGERIYSKFQMPGFDDAKIDSKGVVEISFSELIAPKIIKFTDTGLVSPRIMEHQITKAHLQNDGDLEIAESIDVSLKSDPLYPQLPKKLLDESGIVTTNEEVRQEIFHIIKDAGWHSSVRSDINEKQLSAQKTSISDVKPLDKENLGDRISPTSGQSPDPPRFKGFSSSPLAGQNTVGKTDLKVQTPSEGPDGRALPRLCSTSTLEIGESLPAQLINQSNSPNKSPSIRSSQEIGVKHEENTEDSSDGIQYTPNATEAGRHISSPELPARLSQPGSSIGILNAQNRSLPPVPTVHSQDPSSDEEFPTVENLYSQTKSSQTRSSFEPSATDNQDTSYRDDSESSKVKDQNSRTSVYRISKSRKKKTPAKEQKIFMWSDSDDEADQTTPRPSQGATQSQTQSHVVDLTLSSDPNDLRNDSEYVDDGTQLPEGPGWVRKTRAGSARLSSFKMGQNGHPSARSISAYE